MAMDKPIALDEMSAKDSDLVCQPQAPDAKKGTAGDQADMLRMGKTQELRVR